MYVCHVWFVHKRNNDREEREEGIAGVCVCMCVYMCACVSVFLCLFRYSHASGFVAGIPTPLLST